MKVLCRLDFLWKSNETLCRTESIETSFATYINKTVYSIKNQPLSKEFWPVLNTWIIFLSIDSKNNFHCLKITEKSWLVWLCRTEHFLCRTEEKCSWKINSHRIENLYDNTIHPKYLHHEWYQLFFCDITILKNLSKLLPSDIIPSDIIIAEK